MTEWITAHLRELAAASGQSELRLCPLSSGSNSAPSRAKGGLCFLDNTVFSSDDQTQVLRGDSVPDSAAGLLTLGLSLEARSQESCLFNADV